MGVIRILPLCTAVARSAWRGSTICLLSGPIALALIGLDGESVGEPFELVLLDNMVPEMKGLEVLERIREEFSQVELPVIMVTGNDESEEIVLALKLQANDYVTKPIDFPVLFARMETHIAYKRSHESLRDSQRSLVSAAKMESVAALAAGVAHEIRNPLAQIQMAVDGALGAIGDNAMAKEFLEMSREAIQRADGIGQLLQVHQPETHRSRCE